MSRKDMGIKAWSILIGTENGMVLKLRKFHRREAGKSFQTREQHLQRLGILKGYKVS
jgi:hypothetical protein